LHEKPGRKQLDGVQGFPMGGLHQILHHLGLNINRGKARIGEHHMFDSNTQ